VNFGTARRSKGLVFVARLALTKETNINNYIDQVDQEQELGVTPIDAGLSDVLKAETKAEAELIIKNVRDELDSVRAGQGKTIDSFLQSINSIVPTPETDAVQYGAEEQSSYDTDISQEIDASPFELISFSSYNYISNAKVHNKDHTARNENDLEEEPKKKFISSFLPGFLFYFVLACTVVVAFAGAGRSENGPRNIFGYSYFTVLTGSMEKEIPRGSLVLTKKVEPGELQIGDNITYLKTSDMTITHKIVGIYENYDKTGQRGFQTQGVENQKPDDEIVLAQSVVGKVVYSLPGAGDLLKKLSENLLPAIIFIVLLLILSFTLQIFFGIRKEEKEEKKQDVKKFEDSWNLAIDN